MKDEFLLLKDEIEEELLNIEELKKDFEDIQTQDLEFKVNYSAINYREFWLNFS